jgi:hypothetical protein
LACVLRGWHAARLDLDASASETLRVIHAHEESP